MTSMNPIAKVSSSLEVTERHVRHQLIPIDNCDESRLHNLSSAEEESLLNNTICCKDTSLISFGTEALVKTG